MSLAVKENIKSVSLIILGIFPASFGLKGFLIRNHFIDGGVNRYQARDWQSQKAGKRGR